MDENAYEQYQLERAEARACGVTDFPTFYEWMNPQSVREDAELRVKMEYYNDGF